MPARVAKESEQRLALDLLFQEMPSVSRQARVETLLNWLDNGGLDPEGLLVFADQDGIHGTLLVQRSTGNTAIVGAPQTSIPSSTYPRELTKLALQTVQAWNVDYAQVSLEPATFTFGECFRDAGFEYLTQLEFYRFTGKGIGTPTWPVGLQLRPVSAKQHELFIETLVETYNDSADCAELNGIRDPDDLLLEYQVHSYFPPKWWLLWEGKAQVGVLVLSPGMNQSCELSYFGLIPSARGRKLGQLLFQHAVEEALTLAQEVNLSVDERNTVARQLYLKAGFQLYQLRRIYWWHPSSSPR
jgi:mycothiol synthase